MRFFRYLWYTASAGSFSSLEQEFVCAGIFSFFSSPNPRKNSHWRMVWGVRFENAVQRFAEPQKGASPDPGRPRRIRPGWNRLFSKDRIGEDFSVSLSLSRSVLALKDCQSSKHSLIQYGELPELLRTSVGSALQSETPLPDANSPSSLVEPPASTGNGTLTSDEVCLWAVAPAGTKA